MNRRQFLKSFTLVAGATGLSAVLPAGAAAAAMPAATVQPEDADLYFPQSVASGDPRPTSVILWTRVEDAERSPSWLALQIARDPAFQYVVGSGAFPVSEEHDRCLKVRMTGLRPHTHYFYRFLYLPAGGQQFVASRTGRTRTTPLPDADVPVRFAAVSCQDYIGRYYNTLLKLAQEELDFIVHLGDYIYETSGDPDFQTPGGERAIEFDDEAGAIDLGGFFAARSLDNYRQLHRTYKSDSALQRVQERCALIAIWDDHEFSDDSWQAHGTYHDGRALELDEERKRNAERAYFEFMPVDLEDPAPADRPGLAGRSGLRSEPIEEDESDLYPNTRLYRSLRFGRNVELLLTDYRTFRPDHLIPEDAFPGTLVVDRALLTLLLANQGIDYDAVKASFTPYVDVDSGAFAALKAPLTVIVTQLYVSQGVSGTEAAQRAAAVVRGRMAVPYINGLLAAAGLPGVPDEVIPTLDAGIAFMTMGKSALFGSFGARHLVLKNPYELYAAARSLLGGAAMQSAYGEAQDAWLRERVHASNARWKVVASSVSFTSMVLDLTVPLPIQIPPALRKKFLLTLDQWDGFPNQRRAYVQDLFAAAQGVVLISGDIHASFATQHAPGVVEFTTPAVSSSTFSSFITGVLEANVAPRALIDLLLALIEALLRAANPGIRYTQIRRHGYCLIEAGAQGVRATYRELPEAKAAESFYEDPGALEADYVVRSFVFDGTTLVAQ